MIGWLKGKIQKSLEDQIILDVAGVGYVINCSSNTISNAGSTGDEAEFFIETYVREDQITLFGFASEYEKHWFNSLVKVNGVGPKMAIAILSALAPETLTIAIASQDKSAFKPVSGVGPKLAERIITELKDKTSELQAASESAKIVNIADSKNASQNDSPNNSANNSQIILEAALALEKLGFGRTDSYSAVSRIATKNDDNSVEKLIKEGLKELSSA